MGSGVSPIGLAPICMSYERAVCTDAQSKVSPETILMTLILGFQPLEQGEREDMTFKPFGLQYCVTTALAG